ncbi:hypothetical protein QTP70_001162 [Hemibagrus guttatus]|uniref:Uncharacterized protein n=1 Tax=Hemibagrus guttatus TaxID=175788 RepID=A0AAE0QJA6_9TELE|nr:hypothetical protein QTP70_001162 [Hemibagrus guttatus]
MWHKYIQLLHCHWTVCVGLTVPPPVLSMHNVYCHYVQNRYTKIEAGEQDLCYSTVKFTRVDNDSDHVMKSEQKSEYATVVINTVDLNTPQLDCWDNDISIAD